MAVGGVVADRHAVTGLGGVDADDPSLGHRDSLAEKLVSLHAVLAEHLDLEERALLPLVAMVLTPDEWQAVGAAGSASLPKSATPLVIGMFAYEGDPAVIADMLKPAPLPIRTLVPRSHPASTPDGHDRSMAPADPDRSK